ncbi:MAG: bifunctional nuclease family protein [Phycisphaerales bacterium]|nr:bifunctional nuclease family protein [Phycisphaerales bacterium]
MSVQVELSRIFIREMTDMQIIELRELGGERSFPIVIGLPEACAIERRLKGLEIPRPQTHDLLGSIIPALGGCLKRIEINDLDAGTFYAGLVIEQDGQELLVDSRPSDAIALGIANDVPIFVAEHVIEEAAAEHVEMGMPDDEQAEDDAPDHDADSEEGWD